MTKAFLMSERLAKAMAVFVDTVNMTVTQQKEKVFVIPTTSRSSISETMYND